MVMAHFLHSDIMWASWRLKPYSRQFDSSITRFSNVHNSKSPDSKVHGAHLGPLGPRWAPCWPYEPCYQGGFISKGVTCERLKGQCRSWHWILTIFGTKGLHISSRISRPKLSYQCVESSCNISSAILDDKTFFYCFTYILMPHNMKILYFRLHYFRVSNRALIST